MLQFLIKSPAPVLAQEGNPVHYIIGKVNTALNRWEGNYTREGTDINHWPINTTRPDPERIDVKFTSSWRIDVTIANSWRNEVKIKEWSDGKKSLLHFPVEEYVSPYRNDDILASMGTSTVYNMKWCVPSTTNGAVSASNIIVQSTSSMINIKMTSIDPSKNP